MYDLSVIIAGRNEEFFQNTIDDVLKNKRGETEIIAIVDGYSPDPPLKRYEDVTLIPHGKSIGQRAAVNEGANRSTAKYIMKVDAHCAFDEGFDVKLMADCECDWTVIPRMYNLHAFNWACKECGERTYQGPKIDECACGCTEIYKDIVWKPRLKRKTDFARFDNDLKFQYWKEYGKRAEAQGQIADVMSSVGACFFMERERFWELGGVDEKHGSWGQFGTEIACKSWLSGGRHVVNKNTWFAHMFRTNSHGFSFPYPIKYKDQEAARKYSQDLWKNNKWPKQTRQLSWIIDKFHPVPNWDDKIKISTNYWESFGDGKKYSMDTFKKNLDKISSRLELLPFVKDKKPKTILDVGCGPGLDYEMYKENKIDIEYHGVDSSDAIIDYNKNHFPGIDFQLGSAEKLPFRDNSIDIVTCRALLEHLKSPKLALSEMARVAKQYLCIIWYRVPGEKTKIKLAKNGVYKNTYNSNKMESLISKLGFKLIDKKIIEQSGNKRKQRRHAVWIAEKKTQTKEIDVSVLIPSRNEKYLQATIDDVLSKMKTNFEIIVGLDEYDPKPPLKKDARVRVYRSKKRLGMRPMINRLVSKARGKYVMRLDAHCMIDEGIDQKLIKSYKIGDTVLGVRYELDVENWKRKERTNCDYRYLSHPDVDPKGGLRGLPWPEYQNARKGIMIDETMSLSGSNWLMEKTQLDAWGGLDENHGTFGQEGVEIACKTWLSGGRLLVNKHTWYAHWNRGKACYALGTHQKQKSIDYSIDLWMNDKWPYQRYSFDWLIEKFKPPGWPTKLYGDGIRAGKQGTLFKGPKDISVEELWGKRIALAEPLKRWRIKMYYKTFGELITSYMNGERFDTYEEISKTGYFRYLTTHLANRVLPQNKDKYLRMYKRHIQRKFADSFKLFESIKNEGLHTPLEFYRLEKNIHLWKGYRRLIILHLLGVKTVPVLMHRSIKNKKLPKMFGSNKTKFGIKTIDEITKDHFVKYKGKSTDKYWVHRYTPIYDDLFKTMRHKKCKILELGVAKGASLLLWHEAFPRAQIFGVDKKKDAGKEMAGGLKRVKVFTGEQQDAGFIIKTVMPNGPFNIIIDDCGHQPNDQILSFNMLWPALRERGYYIIEDCFRSFLKRNMDNKEIACVPNEMAKFIENIYTDQAVLSVQFFYNLCVIRKGLEA